MADFQLRNNVSKISAQSVLDIVDLPVDTEWLTEDIDIVISNNLLIAPIIIDFSFSVPTIIEYTLDGGLTFIALNNGVEVTGGQSRFIRVRNGDKLNFRAKTNGVLNRAIIGEP